eukprot:UN01634
MAMVAATLANGGVNPKTGKAIFDPCHVRNCLSLMFSGGLYQFSGEWGFLIGMPAKACKSGGLMLVVPNKMGFATFSPRLTKHGISARGMHFSRLLVEKYNFHLYDNLTGVMWGMDDPCKKPNFSSVQTSNRCYESMWWWRFD